MMIVWLLNSDRISSCIFRSVCWSTLLVGSSKIRNLPVFSIARARQNSCFCPCERIPPSIRMSKTLDWPLLLLLCAFDLSTSHKPTFCSARIMASSVDLLCGSRLDRTDAGNRNGSCVRQISRSRTVRPGTVPKSVSSRTTLPETMLIRRRMASVDELLPLCLLQLVQLEIVLLKELDN